MDLNGTWLMRDFDPGGGEAGDALASRPDEARWMQARVPGDVHSALLEAGLIPDPFYDRNIEKGQWIEDREWWFRKTFAGPSQPGDGETRDLLTFDGLDTFATVYLNGEPLGDHANMFRPAIFDVTERLTAEGLNTLAVRFDPVRLRVAGRSVEGQWGSYGSERVFVRKAQCQFSWDWAPRLVNVGIWQEVHLHRFRTARLLSPHFRTLLVGPSRAVATVEPEVEAWADAEGLQVEVALRRGRDKVTGLVSVGDGPLCMSIPSPALWWPSGLGDQPLYDLEVTLRREAVLLDRFTDRVGIRTLALDRAPDADEVGAESFTFVVNGTKVFAKGANWIPADSLNGRVDRARYQWLLGLFVEANGNMLRVWGGGQYEKDAFYALADELGILVWQDFMFACARYPHDSGFVEEVLAEATHQVRRLRNRPCLALWAGNNENDWAEDLTYWDEPGRDFSGKALYHELLPDIVGRVDPGRPYWPSSPYGGNDHNSEHAGDRHNWHVWHGGVLPRRFGERPRHDPSPEGVNYRHYLQDTARFVSEFGMHASPLIETLRRNVPSSALWLGSETLAYRNKDKPKNKGEALMTAHTGLPRDLAEYIDFSMMCQAEGLKCGIEHYRRRKFRCSGTLFWQWNDCWPGMSWSVVDYYTFPKAGYFFVKRAYTPVLASIEDSAEGVALWVTNDLSSPVEEPLAWRVATFGGEVMYEQELVVRVAANSSRRVAVMPRSVLEGADPAELFAWVEGDQASANRHFFAELKDLVRERPAVSVEWEEDGDAMIARLASDGYAYFVRLFVSSEEARYSDNWFDIPPGGAHVVRLWSASGRRPIKPAEVEVTWR